MRCLLLVTAFGLFVPPVLAGPEILPISGTGYLTYDEATGKITPQTGQRWLWRSLWSATETPWGLYPLTPCESVLDWGDIAGPVPIGFFGFTQYTNSQAADGDLWVLISIYTEENGWNSTGRVLAAAYYIDNIPGSWRPPDEYWGYVWLVAPDESFVLEGSDLDGDALVDWGYAQWFSTRTPGSVNGPAIATFDPNQAPGADEWYDLFDMCPPEPNEPNDGYVGTYSLGPLHQFYFELFAPTCPNQGDSGRYCCADIDGSYDCIVNLADLAQLLSNFGMTTGATLMDGNVDPFCSKPGPWDEDVDLGDLAELLMEYGDDCNWP